jgi:ligand-binding sensor domain-containing protein
MSLIVSGSNIIAGTDEGVFMSANNGQLWTAMNTALPKGVVNALAVNGNYIFAGVAGANGGGVYILKK